jgi:CheY-like chemotaxis protein
MSDDIKDRLAKLERENRILNKKLARSEENRVSLEKTKDRFESVYQKSLTEARESTRSITGLNDLNAAMENAQNISALADMITSFVARFFKIPIAAFFILNREKKLQRVAGFGYPKNKNVPDSFEIGSGFVGQAAKSMEPITVEEIPEYIRITLGFGEAPPKSVYFYPLIYNEEVLGVLELGSFEALTDEQLSWIEQAGKSISAVLRTVIDLSEIKRNEEALNKAKEEAEDAAQELTTALEIAEGMKMEADMAKEEAERLEIIAKEATNAKSDFLANMSHEIRTPMNAIIGMTHLALQTNLDKKQSNFVQKAHGAANNLLTIINDILDFSKIEAGKLNMESINFKLDDVLENLSNMVALKAHEKGLELIFSVAPDVPSGLVGDPLRLCQILLNLTGNSVKFTEKGQIIIKVTNEEPLTKESAILRFDVSDSGIGLSEEQVGKLFQSFSQADGSTTRKYGGTGLGLTISKKLTELMGGKIWVESVHGEGSDFIFTAIFGRHGSDKDRELLPEPNLRGMRLLVVDDNPIMCESLVATLEAMTFNVDSVLSGEQALVMIEQADKLGRPFNLVVMDWMMPGIDGIETTRRIQSNETLSKIPKVIMLTAHGREEVISQAKELGIEQFLLKPVNPSLLFDAIMNIFGYESSRCSNRSMITTDTRTNRLLGARILLVEDNELNQEVALGLMEAAGFDIKIANNGQEAVDKISDRFDIVLMDIQMPVMDGYEATRAIRKMEGFKNLPIVAMTANAMMGDREKCLEAGMQDHVGKPIDPKELFASLEKWIVYRPGLGVSAKIGGQEEEVVELPELSGIDTASGITRVGGNRKLYKKLLLKFVTEYTGAAGEIKRMLDAGANEEAERLAHSVKGIAGNLGMTALQASAGILESAIHNMETDKFEALINAFASRLEEILAVLSVVTPDVTERKEAKREVSGEDLLALLDKLEDPMKSRKPKKCAPVLEEMASYVWPDTVHGKVQDLEKLIGKYKYKKAKKLLNEIKAELG